LLPNDQESNCPLKNFCKPLKNLIEGSKQLWLEHMLQGLKALMKGYNFSLESSLFGVYMHKLWTCKILEIII
jgi:hypothetical protein